MGHSNVYRDHRTRSCRQLCWRRQALLPPALNRRLLCLVLQVEKFLVMAEQALKARTARNEALSKELESAKSERQRVRPHSPPLLATVWASLSVLRALCWGSLMEASP